MPFTLKDLLNFPIMKQAKVHTAFDVLTIRPIESVSVIEIPVEDFVHKNELVISTAIGCNDDQNIFKGFVADIIEAGASALVIATGRHLKKIPEEVLQLTESHHFPIIEIPWKIRFADIIASVFKELNTRHLILLERYEDLQNRLLNLFLDGSPISDALELIRKELGYPVVLVDTEGKIKGKSKHSEELLEFLLPYLQKAALSSECCGAAEAFNIKEDDILIQKIQSGHKLHGYMFFKLVPGKINLAYSSNEKDILIKNVTSSIMLWFQKEQAVKETEIRLRDDFIWSITKEEVDSWDDMSLRATSLGYNLSIPYMCITGLIDNFQDLYKSSQQVDTSYEQWLYNNINIIKENILWAGKHLRLATLVTYQESRLIIFLEIRDNQLQQCSNNLLDLIENRTQKTFPDLVFSWGIGDNHIGIKTFHEGFIDANAALEICYKQKGAGSRGMCTNTGIYRALMKIANNSEMQEITHSTIGELVKYDRLKGLDLIKTLNTYIQNQGNVSQTARALNLHRQSLLYRLKKIEILTNRSLIDRDDLFLLDLSIRLWMCSPKQN